MGSILKSTDVDWNSYIGREIGNVTIVKEVGRGVMGVVFCAYQKTLKRQVAVKVLKKNQHNQQLASELFRDEGEVVGVLAHPNIIPVFEMGETDDCFYQIMQLVDGIDLRTTIRRLLKHPVPYKRTMPISEAINIAMQIADALGYAHEENVVHQDIKPANILIENRLKRPLVADFGIARALEGEYKSDGLVVGSPLYMAPEQARCESTDGRADIYSIGVMLFEMTVGMLPIRMEEKVDQIIERKKQAPETFFTKKPSEISPLVCRRLDEIIKKAIEPDIEKRYARCEELRDDLKDYLERNRT